jgi:hypothetical protein
MSDNLRQYRAIREALRQAYPGELHGRCARHVTTLAALISGIVASKSTHLPKVAAQVPNGTKPENRVKRFARWLDNEHILEEVYFVPYAEILLAHLAMETLVLVMDGSVVGHTVILVDLAATLAIVPVPMIARVLRRLFELRLSDTSSRRCDSADNLCPHAHT